MVLFKAGKTGKFRKYLIVDTVRTMGVWLRPNHRDPGLWFKSSLALKLDSGNACTASEMGGEFRPTILAPTILAAESMQNFR